MATATETSKMLSGNGAAALGAMLSRVRLIPGYPITPQTPILEKLSELVDEGSLQADLMTVESEHSAMCAAMAGSLGGVRVFTATASQGLFYMHEPLHFAASSRAPLVLVGVNRSHSLPWAFWADHGDTLSQRDTGWAQLYCETPQEALDMVPIAYRIAESLFIPVMIMFEAVYVSHTYEPVAIPAQETVDAFLPPFPDQFRLNVADPRGLGSSNTAAAWAENRLRMHEAHLALPETATQAFREWADLTGREYGLLEPYCCEDADLVLLTIGGPAGTAREAVDALRAEGVRVGCIKQRLVRPAPVLELRTLLTGAGRAARKVAVVDRNCTPGLGGIVGQEVRAALQGVAGAPAVHGVMAGLGGTELNVSDMVAIARQVAAESEPSPFGTVYRREGNV